MIIDKNFDELKPVNDFSELLNNAEKYAVNFLSETPHASVLRLFCYDVKRMLNIRLFIYKTGAHQQRDFENELKGMRDYLSIGAS